MRSTLTISLAPELKREVDRISSRRQTTSSAFVRDAIQEKLWREAIDDSRRILVPKARAQGIYTDEDVFAEFS
jgi:predicted transcriptional regulator